MYKIIELFRYNLKLKKKLYHMYEYVHMCVFEWQERQETFYDHKA